MPLPGLFALVCAGAITAAEPITSQGAVNNSDKAISTALAVQTALQQGREYLLHGEYKAAVSTLEAHLPFINGNRVYLKALEDAYRGYIKELRLARQNVDAQRYLERLLYLDKGALLDKSLTGATAAIPSSAPGKQAEPNPSKAAPTFRAKNLEDRSRATRIQDRASAEETSGLLAQAEKEFSAKHFREARLLYEQIARGNESALSASTLHKERWAYCKLYSVVEQVNQSGQQMPAWTDLEQEVHLAVGLAPRLEGYGKNLLTQIQKYRADAPAADQAGTAVSIHHGERNAQGWIVAETTNFRIFYKQSPDLAEQAAQVIERARAQAMQKWLGGADSWSRKCDLYLHATADDYSKETGKTGSPGHSLFKIENGRMVICRMDVHCEHPDMLTAVLPHETTHVVLANAFGGQLVPRWVDEGMAVLSEPREKVQRYLDKLVKSRQNDEMFHLKDLMQLENYPQNPRYVGAFYAQSVSLVEFLTSQKGPQEFTLFLHDSMRYGEENALKRHYGYQGFADLEQQWFQAAFREQAAAGRPR